MRLINNLAFGDSILGSRSFKLLRTSWIAVFVLLLFSIIRRTYASFTETRFMQVYRISSLLGIDYGQHQLSASQSKAWIVPSSLHGGIRSNSLSPLSFWNPDLHGVNYLVPWPCSGVLPSRREGKRAIHPTSGRNPPQWGLVRDLRFRFELGCSCT